MSPPDAKRVAGRIDVHLVTLVGRESWGGLNDPSSKFECFIVSALRILDVKVEVYLLFGYSLGPLGRSVVRGVLHTDQPLPTLIDNAVELFIIRHHVAIEQCGPEGAFHGDIGRVEHDDVSDQFHTKTLSAISVSSRGNVRETTPPSRVAFRGRSGLTAQHSPVTGGGGQDVRRGVRAHDSVHRDVPGRVFDRSC